MAIIAGIITALIGAGLGFYVQYIVTFRVKGEIEAVDFLYKQLRKFNIIFEDIITAYASHDLVERDRLGKEIRLLIEETYFYSIVAIRNSQFHMDFKELVDIIIDILNDKNSYKPYCQPDASFPESPETKIYKHLSHALHEKIKNYRKRLTSLGYQLSILVPCKNTKNTC